LSLHDNRTLAWALAALVMLVALLWPALWNGFPIVFYDTGGYLVRVFDRDLGFGRSAIYGAFLAAGIPLKLWVNVAVQAAMIAWLIVVTLRVFGFGGRPWLAAAIVCGLCIFTGLPWFTAQLMPDILMPAAVLGLYLLAFHLAALRGWERATLTAIIAFGMASHMTVMGVAIGLAAAFALLAPFAPRLALPRPALLAPAGAIAVGILLAPVSNFSITGRFAFTPGGANFVFARIVEDGILARFLAEHCPDPALRICAYRGEVPATGNDWLWGDTPLWDKLGGPQGFDDEAGRIVARTFALYPGAHAMSALRGMAEQFVLIRTADHLKTDNWHTRWAIETRAPSVLAAFQAGRQERDMFDIHWIEAVHVPVALAGTALLFVVIGYGLRRRVAPPVTALALIVLLALIGNAAICGAVSIPSDRYQSRLVWLAPFAVVLAALGRSRFMPRREAHGSDVAVPT
jgi:hypothetical protein